MKRPESLIATDPVLRRATDPSWTGARPSPLPVQPLASLRRTLAGKRAFDYTLSLLILVPAAVTVLACALLVRLTSRGPAFYAQQRVGRYGRVFTIYKLRSMYHHCERHTGPTWSVPGDPRVTTVGRVLRALHLDELPQLWNVLRGEMSLIGPRPERPEIAARLAELIEDYDSRSAILPGITGHAQVHLPPDVSVADVRDKIRLDRYYMARFSIWFDVLTLFRTARKVVGI